MKKATKQSRRTKARKARQEAARAWLVDELNRRGRNRFHSVTVELVLPAALYSELSTQALVVGYNRRAR